jgi:hypothetical protein
MARAAVDLGKQSTNLITRSANFFVRFLNSSADRTIAALLPGKGILKP